MSASDSSLLSISFYGLLRSLAVEGLINPLEVVKTRLQTSSHPSEKISTLTQELFRTDGLSGFYRGLSLKLISKTIKPLWSWPLIVKLPKYLEKSFSSSLQRQLITGLVIASLDTVLFSPLDKTRVHWMALEKRESFLSLLKKGGWDGSVTYWMKHSVAWTSFLLSQEYLRTQAKKKEPGGSLLSPISILTISGKVALIVSLAMAPFDRINTLKQLGKLSPQMFRDPRAILRSYQGWSLTATSLLIQNMASISLIEQLR